MGREKAEVALLTRGPNGAPPLRLTGGHSMGRKGSQYERPSWPPQSHSIRLDEGYTLVCCASPTAEPLLRKSRSESERRTQRSRRGEGIMGLPNRLHVDGWFSSVKIVNPPCRRRGTPPPRAPPKTCVIRVGPSRPDRGPDWDGTHLSRLLA